MLNVAKFFDYLQKNAVSSVVLSKAKIKKEIEAVADVQEIKNKFKKLVEQKEAIAEAFITFVENFLNYKSNLNYLKIPSYVATLTEAVNFPADKDNHNYRAFLFRLYLNDDNTFFDILIELSKKKPSYNYLSFSLLFADENIKTFEEYLNKSVLIYNFDCTFHFRANFLEPYAKNGETLQKAMFITLPTITTEEKQKLRYFPIYLYQEEG